MSDRDAAHWRDYARRCAAQAGLPADDAEDAAQEALVDLIGGWGNADGRDPAPYYRRIVGNAVRQVLRARRRHEGLDEDALVAPDAYEASDRFLQAQADLAAIQGQLAGLTPYQREVMLLVADGHTTAEIAARLGRSYYAVETARRDARRKAQGAADPAWRRPTHT